MVLLKSNIHQRLQAALAKRCFNSEAKKKSTILVYQQIVPKSVKYRILAVNVIVVPTFLNCFDLARRSDTYATLPISIKVLSLVIPFVAYGLFLVTFSRFVSRIEYNVRTRHIMMEHYGLLGNEKRTSMRAGEIGVKAFVKDFVTLRHQNKGFFFLKKNERTEVYNADVMNTIFNIKAK